MIRIVIENLLLFLLPTVIYVIYVYIRGRGDGNETAVLNDAPLIWLFLAGVVLLLSMLLVFGSTSGWQSGLPYQPPVFKDGKIEPGHVAQ